MADHAGVDPGVVSVASRRRRTRRSHSRSPPRVAAVGRIVTASSLFFIVALAAALVLFPAVVADATGSAQGQQTGAVRLERSAAGADNDDEGYAVAAAGADQGLKEGGQWVEEEDADPPHGAERGGPWSDAAEDAETLIDMTSPEYLAEHEQNVMEAEAEAEYQQELEEASMAGDDEVAEGELPADKKLAELEDRLYFGNLTVRNVSDAFKGLFEFVASAPTLEEAKEMNRVVAGGAKEAKLKQAHRKLADAQAEIIQAFGIEDAAPGEEAITLEDAPGEEGKYHVKFNLRLATGNGVGAAKAQAIFRAMGMGARPDASGEDSEEPDQETLEAVAAVRTAIQRALLAKQQVAGATDDEDPVDNDDAPVAPEHWPAQADALYLLAALVEAGVVPLNAYPSQSPLLGQGEAPDEGAGARHPFASYTDADYFAGWSARAVSDDGRHPAAVDPKGWVREALLVAAEMGSTEARLAVGDRILHGRGGPPEAEEGPNCEAALEWIRPVADQVAKDAEESGDFQLPRHPARLRERERDAGWVSEEELENGDDQVSMEEDMAARGVPEAQRHIGYRRLVGRGLERDEAGALREFEAAAANGDELAAFNLGYMHMKGLSVPQNFTEARRRFDAAIAKDLPAAFNGIGVLHFNGWGTERNLTAARLAFEQGAARGDPDSHFNLGALYASGLGVEVDHKMAVKSYEAASQAGHWRAPHVLAVAHQTGKGTPRNCTRAAQLFQVFIEERLQWTRDQEEAMHVLDGGLVTDTLEDGTDAGMTHKAPPDAWSALVRYTLLSEKGSESATSNAAWMLSKGMGYDGPDRLDLSERMHERSVMMGNMEAHVDLGDIKWAKLKMKGRLVVSSLAAVEASNADVKNEFSGDEHKAKGHEQVGTLAAVVTGEDDNGAEVDTRAGLPRPRPLKPPTGATLEEEIAFHYGEAAHAGYIEGAVNLAWAHAHGVGVARNLSRASELLLKAYADSPSEAEALAPLLALAGVKCLTFAEMAADALGLGRALWNVVGVDWGTPRWMRGGAGKDPRVAGAGGYSTQEDTLAEEGGGGSITAEAGAKLEAAWVPHAYTTLENVLLGVLFFAALLVGYTRYVVMERPERAVAAVNAVQEVPVAAIAGPGAAVAFVIGICIIVFASRAAVPLL